MSLGEYFQHSRIADRVVYDHALAQHTTFRIGGAAEAFLACRSVHDLYSVMKICRREGIALHVVGGGSNLLLPDEGVEGVVITLAGIKASKIEGESVRVQAGAKLSSVVARTTRAGLAGLESLAGIPGTIGGAVAMNAGGRYGEIGDCVESVRILTSEGGIAEFTKQELNFQYRKSDLRGGIVIDVSLRFARGNAEELVATASEIARAKLASQPYRVPSAGCIFRNPDGSEWGAGQLIDKAGLKGKRIGGAMISPLHANFIVNTGGATADDVRALIVEAQKEVAQRFGIELKTEVKRWAA